MKEFLDYQYKNAFIWMPFVMAFGAALYFGLNSEPIFNFPVLITLLLVFIFFKFKNIVFRALIIFLFGFFYAMSFTHIINTPQIKDSFGFVDVNGIVQDVDFSTDSTRIILNVPEYKQNQTSIPQNVNFQINIKNAPDNLHIGDSISGSIKTFHTNGKYTPGAFDFARWTYFAKVSGVGFFKDYKIIPSTNDDLHIRTYIHEKSKSKLTDALVLGYKHSIPKQESDIWKSVGIAHVWSISGFHMTLVGGWLFMLFYLLFRAIPYITKRIPAKYPAIICAWFGLVFYLCISGISVATTRAFLMATLIFIATLFSRSVFSLRNGALAFLIIFLINPFYVMHAGFQLSFAAIFGLLWFFETKKYIKRNIFRKIFHIAYLSLMTATVATIFTLPFIIAHFGYILIYSLIGNFIILPIFSVLIMPLIMIGTMLSLFGNHFLIHITQNIYDYTLSFAKNISDLPFANLDMPFVSNSVLILCIIGLLFLILTVKKDSENFFMKHINYVLCCGCIIFATIIYTTESKPLFFATEKHELVGFVVDGKLKFNKSSDSNNYYAFNTWRKFNNEKTSDKNERYKCDHGFCFYQTSKWNLVYMQNFTSILNNIEKVCSDKSIDYIVTTFDIDSLNCHAKILHNGLLIYPNGKIREFTNSRPWHNQP